MTNIFLYSEKRMTVSKSVMPIKCLFFLLLSFNATGSHANSVMLSVGQFDYRTNMTGDDIDYKPSGVVLGGSLDISETTTLQYELGKWSDRAAGDNMHSDFDSTMLTLGMTHDIGDWQYSIFYSDLEDEITAPSSGQGAFNLNVPIAEDKTVTDVMSVELNASYQLQSGNWAYYADIGLQYNDATSVGSLPQIGGQPFRQDDQSTFAMLSLGADKYIANNDMSGWLIGSTVTWYQELSSDSEMALGPVRRPGRGGQNGDNVGNRTSGDSFGVLGLYANYIINSKWSIELSSSFGFAGDFNANTYGVTLGYDY